MAGDLFSKNRESLLKFLGQSEPMAASEKSNGLAQNAKVGAAPAGSSAEQPSLLQKNFDALRNLLTPKAESGTMGVGDEPNKETMFIEEGVVGEGMFDLNSFVDTLGEWEGRKDHTDQIGKFTYGYGVLPETARQFGVSYDGTADRRENALKVYDGLFKQIKKEQPDLDFNVLGNKVATAVFSTYINLGSFKNAQTLANKLKEGDIEGAADSLFMYKNVREGGEVRASKGLVARRVKEYNLFQRALGKTDFVRRVDVEGTRDNPVFVLKDAEGKELKRIDSKYPLAKSNSMKFVSIPAPTEVASVDQDKEFLSKAEKITKSAQA